MEVGQPRRADWTGPVATSAEGLERLLTDRKLNVLVALAPGPKETGCLKPMITWMPLHYANSVEWAQEVGQQLVWCRRKSTCPCSSSLRVNACVCRCPQLPKRIPSFFVGAPTVPGSDIRRWACAAVPQMGHRFKDTWGWNLSGEHFQGLIRVDVGFWQAKSWRPVDSSNANRRVCRAFDLGSSPAPLLWPESDLSKAATDAVAEAKRWGLGLRLGHRQVGVRRPPPTKRADSIPRWRLIGLSHEYAAEDVQVLASNAGFQEVEIIEKYRWRQGIGWAIRATRIDRVQHLDFCCFGRADRKPTTAIMPSPMRDAQFFAQRGSQIPSLEGC